MLATIKCKHENEKFVTIFWKTFCDAFQEVNGAALTFNPRGWCVDMATCNFSGVCSVFGNGVLNRMKGCEFHYRQSYTSRSKGLQVEFAGQFDHYAKELLYASTPTVYETTLNSFLSFLKSDISLIPLLEWLKWWNERKEFMFRVYTSIDAPSSNLGEVVSEK